MHSDVGTSASREERVILVNASDQEMGSAPKLQAHERGLLHRAFSIVLTDGTGRVLLQQRAASKYHSPSLWTNSCCGHPRPGESTHVAATRRLAEELGVHCALEHGGAFEYRAHLGNGLIEHEVDHVFVGRFTGAPEPDEREVANWRWVSLAEARREATDDSSRFSAWFLSVLSIAAQHRLLHGTAQGLAARIADV